MSNNIKERNKKLEQELQAVLLYTTTVNKILSYLSTRPWNESNELIQEIQSTSSKITEEHSQRIKSLEENQKEAPGE